MFARLIRSIDAGSKAPRCGASCVNFLCACGQQEVEQCSSWQELEAKFASWQQQRGAGGLDHKHCSALWNRLAVLLKDLPPDEREQVRDSGFLVELQRLTSSALEGTEKGRLAVSNVATTLHCLGALQHPKADIVLVRKLVARLGELRQDGYEIGKLGARQLAESLSALAALGVAIPEAVMKACQRAVRSRLADFSPQELADMAWVVERLQPPEERARLASMRDELAEALRRQLGRVDPEGLARSAEAFARMFLARKRPYWGALLRELRRRDLAEFPAPALVSLLWALGNVPQLQLQARDPELLAALAAATARKAPQLDAFGLVRALKGFATLEANPGRDGLDALAAAGVSTLGDRPREMAAALEAFAALGHYPGKKLLDAFAAAIPEPRQLAGFTLQDVSRALWALATLRSHPGEAVLDAFAAAAAQKASAFELQALADVLWAFGALHFHPGSEVLEALGAAAAAKPKNHTARSLAMTLWGLAKLRHPPREGLLEAGWAMQATGKSPQGDKPTAKDRAMREFALGKYISCSPGQ